MIPKGTILEALNPSGFSGSFEGMPVMVNGESGEEYIIETLVPEVISRKIGFKKFSVSLNKDLIGEKLKKL
jgi:hypothetical protein